MTTGTTASLAHWAGVVGVGVAAAGPRRWWRYVKYGRPVPWRVTHEGSMALYVTDPGRDRLTVAARLREHGGLPLGEAVRRADDPSRPVWDDLTSGDADQLSAILREAGATVRTGPRPGPSWARDVSRDE